MSTAAIEGGAAECGGIVWPKWPVHGEEERRAVTEVLECGKWWYGEKVAAFEREYAAFQDAKYGVSCVNGTAALRMGLVACGIGSGDEVIVPPYTFVATAFAPMLIGAVPVFADVDLETANLSIAAVERAITSRTKAIMPVHFAGLPCDMDSLLSLARDRGIRVIEDACHSWGTKYHGKGTGAIGECGAFSFQMSKNITAGEGGILLTDDADIAARARSYANCGRAEGQPWYEHHIVADNLRLTEIQAAILSCQLARLEAHTATREANAKILDSALSSIPGIELPPRPPEVDVRSYHLYTFRFTGERWSIDRDHFAKALAAEGVPCSTGYPIPLPRQPLFAGTAASRAQVPNTERICREAVWITHPLLLAPSSDVERIGKAIEKLAGVYCAG